MAGATQPIFTADAIAEIARCSQGIPRRINVVCDAALCMGFGRKQRPIDRDVILQVERMLQRLQESDAATASSEPACERETAMPVAPPAAAYGPPSDGLAHAVRSASPDVLVRPLSPPAATMRAQLRVKRRGFWWSLLGGMAAGSILSLITWGDACHNLSASHKG
jgi:hypothetical protein